MTKGMTVTVHSSHGHFEIDWTTGEVTAVYLDLCGEDDDDLATIKRFDVDEWRKTHSECCTETPTELDILDLGYWYLAYETPEPEWRRENAADPPDPNMDPPEADGTTERKPAA